MGQRENFSGQVPAESLRTQDSEYLYVRGVEEMPVEQELPAK